MRVKAPGSQEGLCLYQYGKASRPDLRRGLVLKQRRPEGYFIAFAIWESGEISSWPSHSTVFFLPDSHPGVDQVSYLLEAVDLCFKQK
jgi:hypothetical protein